MARCSVFGVGLLEVDRLISWRRKFFAKTTGYLKIVIQPDAAGTEVTPSTPSDGGEGRGEEKRARREKFAQKNNVYVDK